jgi:predicted RNase H-like HicB family nuclease
MSHAFTMEYWLDGEWYVGRLKEAPGVFSQGATLEELESNLAEVFHLMLEDLPDVPPSAQCKELVLNV